MSSPSATTSLPIDTTQLAPREPSICIPRVFANITEARVLAIFKNLDLGQIERVDMIKLTNDKGENFQRVFIHFTEWYDTTEAGEPNASAIEVRQRLLKGIQVKVVYDDPWFWKLSASRVARPEDRKKRVQRPRPFLDLSHTARAPDIRRGGNQSGNHRGGKAPLSKAQRQERRANQQRHTPSPQAPPTNPNAPRKAKGTRRSPPPPLKLVEVVSVPSTPTGN